MAGLVPAIHEPNDKSGESKLKWIYRQPRGHR